MQQSIVQGEDGAQLAHRFFDATAAGDLETVRSLCTGDAVVWHNYDQRAVPFSRILPALMQMRSILADFSYADRRYLAVPDGAILQHRLQGTLPGGQRIDAPMMVRVHMEAMRIRRFEEYLNPADTAPLAAALGAVHTDPPRRPEAQITEAQGLRRET